MAIAIIDTWLKDPLRSFEQGQLLYEQYGTSKLLKVLFSKGHEGSHYHFTRLNEALAELNKIYTSPQTSRPAALSVPKLENVSVPSRSHGLSDADWAKASDQERDLRTLNSKLHTHSQLLFNQSRITTSEAERLPLDLMILEERAQINKNWEKIRYIQQMGDLKQDVKLSETTKIDGFTVTQLAVQLKNIPTYLSKDRERLKKLPDGPAKRKVEQRILEREIQLELVKKRLEGKS